MHDDQWQRVKDVFAEAMAAPPGERGACIERACGADGGLRSKVERLMRAHAEAERFLCEATQGEGVAASPNPSSDLLGSSAGPYTLVRLIGEGGFGSVYLAEQRVPVVRTVALKIIKLGMDTRQVIARFEAERQALAMMDHPNIARVLDAGATPEGRPFFVMELVRGVPITKYCDESKLSIPERLDLFVTVCHAVQHAHQNGIIHRDLKPSNIMVTMQDGRTIPKVIDFGIAKATSARLTERTLFTELRQWIGTPEYMSPEQAQPGGADAPAVDTRSDIYSLGVLLYELLTGMKPFESSRLRSAALGEIQRIIREEEPPKPSTRLSEAAQERGGTRGGLAALAGEDGVSPVPSDQRWDLASIAHQRQSEPTRLSRELRGDLDWIVMKALEKDRVRRYPTAAEFASDVQRFIAHEPVLAGPPSGVYRARKFARRHRGVVLAASAVLLTLVMGMAGTSAGLVWALRERDRAEVNRERAETSAALAIERQEQATKIAEFQSSMLDQLDAEIMGEQMRLEWRRQVESGLRRRFIEGADGRMRELNDEEVAAGVDEFIRAAAPGNPADVARAVMDASLLTPAVAAIDRDFSDQPTVEASLRLSVGYIYQVLGMYPAVGPQYRRALELRRQVFGEQHADVAKGLVQMAMLHFGAGELALAEQRLREALAIYRGLSSEDHADLATCLNNLGTVLWEMGDYNQGEALVREALAMHRRLLGNEHPDVMRALMNVGTVIQQKGDYAAARPLLEEAVKLCREVHPGLRADLGTGLTMLGKLHHRLAEFAAAELLFREAVVLFRAHHGEEHPNVAMALAFLANLVLDQGDYAGAEALFREALAIRRRLLGGTHRFVASSLSDLAGAVWDRGDTAGAEALYREALAINRVLLGDEHRDVAVIQGNLADLLSIKGELAEAEAMLQAALAIGRKVYAGGHADLAANLNGLGFVLLRRGDTVGAEPLLREALAMYRATLGDEHPNVASALLNLGRMLKDRREFAEAEARLREALALLRRALGDGHPHVAVNLMLLAAVLHESDRPAAAEPMYREALDIRRKLLGDAHPETLKTITGLAQALMQIGSFAEAETLLLESHAGHTSRFGEADTTTRNAASHLIDTYDAWHVADPNKGHDAAAAEWRARLAPPPEHKPPE